MLAVRPVLLQSGPMDGRPIPHTGAEAVSLGEPRLGVASRLDPSVVLHLGQNRGGGNVQVRPVPLDNTVEIRVPRQRNLPVQEQPRT